MPTFSRNLEESLQRALTLAKERHHEFATLEHLLLSLVDDSDAAAVMRASSVDLDKLRQSLVAFLESAHDLVADREGEPNPTSAFQRVVQRATIHAQHANREEVHGANVLVAMFNEKESHAAYFLREQDMTRYDAVNYLSYGIAKNSGTSETRPIHDAEEEHDTRSDVQVTLRVLKAKIAALERLIGRQAVEIEMLKEELKKIAPDPN